MPLFEGGGIKGGRQACRGGARAGRVVHGILPKERCEVSLICSFQRWQLLRFLEGVLALKKETEGLLDEIIGGTNECERTDTFSGRRRRGAGVLDLGYVK